MNKWILKNLNYAESLCNLVLWLWYNNNKRERWGVLRIATGHRRLLWLTHLPVQLLCDKLFHRCKHWMIKGIHKMFIKLDLSWSKVKFKAKSINSIILLLPLYNLFIVKNMVQLNMFLYSQFCEPYILFFRSGSALRDLKSNQLIAPYLWQWPRFYVNNVM